MKRLLVTGGAGFIGSNFIQYMLGAHEDIEIINLDKLTYAGNLENLKSVETNQRYTFIQGDIADRNLVVEILSSQEFYGIINFAAETHVDRSIAKPDEFLNTDVFGTFSLLEGAVKHKIERYLQISTDEVYGSIPKGESASESSALNPSSPYSAGKGGGDLLTRAYFTTYHLPTLITRAANNYGPFQYPEKFIPLFVTNAIENEPLPLYGDGSQIREWLYVEDHCRAIDLVLHQGQPGEVYNVGGYCEEENRVIAAKIVEILGKPNSLIQFVEDRPGHDVRYSVDDTKLRSLGWEPQVSIDEGLERTVRWYVDHPGWWRRLKDSEYRQYYRSQYGKRLAGTKSL
jgi:dTDP-glucose 4,6-dehydratase